MAVQVIPIPTEVVSHSSHSHSQLCVQFPFPWDSHGIPGPIGNPNPMHISTRDPLAGFKGPTSRGGEGRAGKGKGGGARPVCLFVLTILATGPSWDGRWVGVREGRREGGNGGLEAPFVKS